MHLDQLLMSTPNCIDLLLGSVTVGVKEPYISLPIPLQGPSHKSLLQSEVVSFPHLGAVEKVPKEFKERASTPGIS